MPRQYASEADLMQEGVALHLRPFQLPHRIDFGLRGTSDAEPYSKSVQRYKMIQS